MKYLILKIFHILINITYFKHLERLNLMSCNFKTIFNHILRLFFGLKNCNDIQKLNFHQ